MKISRNSEGGYTLAFDDHLTRPPVALRRMEAKSLRNLLNQMHPTIPLRIGDKRIEITALEAKAFSAFYDAHEGG